MTPALLAQVMEASWPPKSVARIGPWAIRDGAQGGKRVSAATAEAAWTVSDIAVAEAAMHALGQLALFAIRVGDEALDAALHDQGYALRDPVVAYVGDCATLAQPAAPRLRSFAHWPPMQIAVQLWDDAGIDAARRAVMDRVVGDRSVILARTADRPAGVAFVALVPTDQGAIAMLHALEVAPQFRRQGSAQNILRTAAGWAQARGADRLALVVTRANDAARGLYAGMGMQVAGQYHYRER